MFNRFKKIKSRDYYQSSTAYGKIYAPNYNSRVKIQDTEPKIFSAEGRQLKTIFIRDKHFAHAPYYFHSYYIFLDRFNIGKLFT
jgi:hypothetical protein